LGTLNLNFKTALVNKRKYEIEESKRSKMRTVIKARKYKNVIFQNESIRHQTDWYILNDMLINYSKIIEEKFLLRKQKFKTVQSLY